DARLHLVAEQLPDNLLIYGQRVLREHRIAELLELLQDFVIDAGIVVIRPAQQHDSQAVFGFQLLENFARLAAHNVVRELVQRLQALLHGAIVLFFAQAQNVLPVVIHLAMSDLVLVESNEGVLPDDALLLEQVGFLGESRLHRCRGRRHRGAGAAGLGIFQKCWQGINHGEENDVELLLGVDDVQQIVHVRNPNLRREAGINGAALGAFLVELLAGVLGPEQVFRLHAQRLEVGGEEGPAGIHVEGLGHADLEFAALLHQLNALLLGRGDGKLGQRVGHYRRLVILKGRLGRHFHQIRVLFLDGVNVALDDAHLVHILHRSLFAGGDDQALRALGQRHLGFGGRLVIRVGRYRLDVNESAQTLVLAEVAARVLVTGGGEADGSHALQADELGLHAVLPQAHRLEGAADGAGFAAVLVNDHLGLHFLALEAGLDKVHLRLHRRQVVLRAALQDEFAPDGGQVGNLRHVQPDVFRQHVTQAGHDLFRLPTLALEVHDIGLHEHGAAITELRVAFGAEGDVGKLLHLEAEAFAGALQEVAVAGGALGVELEILYAAILENDDLDVLAAYVADDIRVRIEMQRGLRVGHGLRSEERRV